MSAPLQSSAIPVILPEVIRWIPIERLLESERNPRQYYPDAKQRELVESIRTGGFRPWMAIVARPAADDVWRIPGLRDEECFEIGAGHRRTRAAKEAGITELPCFIRPMTDEQFLEVLNFDNSGREDVHPLDEAAGWHDWMKSSGKGVSDIAAKIGRSIEYVYQRLKYTELIEPAREAFLDGRINAGEAILIARRNSQEQEKALKFALTEDWQHNRPTVRKLARELEDKFSQDLARCPFDRADRGLVAGAGDCEKCPKRAANIPGYEFDPAVKDHPDLCTDKGCYRQKLTNHLVRIRTDLEVKGKKVIPVNDWYGKAPKGGLNLSQYEEGEGKDSQTGLVVEGYDIGKVLQIRVKKSTPATATRSGGSAPVDYEKERREQKEKWQVELPIRRRILGAVAEKIGAYSVALVRTFLAEVIRRGNVGEDVVAELCLLLGVKGKEHQEDEALAKAVNSMAKLLVLATIDDDVFDEWQGLRVGSDKPLLELAVRFKVDAAKIRKAAEHPGLSPKPEEKPVAAKAAPVKSAPVKAKPKKPVKKAAKPATKKVAKKK